MSDSWVDWDVEPEDDGSYSTDCFNYCSWTYEDADDEWDEDEE